jgi:hypothetical protein
MTKFSDPYPSRPITLVSAMLQHAQAQQEQVRQRLANMPTLPPPPQLPQQQPPNAQYGRRSLWALQEEMQETRELCALISSILEEDEGRDFSSDGSRGPGPASWSSRRRREGDGGGRPSS